MLRSQEVKDFLEWNEWSDPALLGTAGVAEEQSSG